MIVAAYAGTGKSEFCKRYPNDTVDLISMPFKYSNFYEISKGISEGEDVKANKNLILRPNWELYYYWSLKRLCQYCPEKTIVIPTIKSIMRFMETDGIPYKVVYPNKNCKEEYIERYVKRGNSQEFLEVFVDGWDIMLDGLDNLGGTVIELESGQFLSDVIKPFEGDGDQYIERQLLSFKHSLEWENPRAKKLKEKLEEEQLQKAKKHYMNQLFINGGSRCQHTFTEFKESFEQEETIESNDGYYKLGTNQIDYAFGLIEKVINEVNLNYFEYAPTGEHLRFTQKISLTDLNTDRALTRCIDKNNYLDVHYNPRLLKLDYEDITNLSLKYIEQEYLKEYLDIMLGILRKGNCYWKDVISEEISDDLLIKMICKVYKQMLLEAYVYREGLHAKDQIIGIFYMESICSDDVIDDYICVTSKTELKHILNEIDTYSSYLKPRFSLLEVKYKEDKPVFYEKNYDEKILQSLCDFL